MPKLIVSIGGAFVVLVSPVASAAGLWNLPTTGRQFLGVGYGAGYHAPLVVNAPWRGKATSPGVTRVATPPLRTSQILDLHPTSLGPPDPSRRPRPSARSPQGAPDFSREGAAAIHFSFGPPPLNVPQAEIYIEPIAVPPTLDPAPQPGAAP